MDIGIFGGTFNPIHVGHLIVAEHIRECFRLTGIYFVPSAIPPHKEGPVLEGKHRLKMVALATYSNPFFYTSSMEVDRGGRSYTIDTVCQMRRELGEGHTFYFILGADAFRDISTWKDCAQLLQSCRFIVISRPGAKIGKIAEDLSITLKKHNLNLALKIIGRKEAFQDIDLHAADIFFVPVPKIDISSSIIRKMIRTGKSIRYQVPDEVEQYIVKNRLYLE
ncbi:MAG: nicotinate-nucleotide adenylyltransferase [bacterium]